MTEQTVADSRAGWQTLAAVLAFGPVLLFMDSRTRAAWPDQFVLGLLTFAVLWFASWILPQRDRRVLWVCLPVATAFEVLGSLVWKGYHYRYGGIPAFVPFGHGLIYVFGLGLSATPFVRRHERRFTSTILAVAVLWAVAGLIFLPRFTLRADVHGVLWLPLFAYVLLYSPRRAFFASIFIATANIELFGTWFHSWMWAPHTPWFHVTSGNPPSAIAGGYAVIDGTVLALCRLNLKKLSKCLPLHEIGMSLRLLMRRSTSATSLDYPVFLQKTA